MRWLQRGLALLAIAVVVVLARYEWWPFNTDPAGLRTYNEPGVWEYLFSDRYVLGVVRLALAAIALYFVVSVPALVVAARWAKGFGTTGITADEADKASKTLEDYEKELTDTTSKLDEANATIERIRQQRDTALNLVRGLTTSTTSTLGTSGQTVSPPIVGQEGTSDDAERDQDEASGTEPGGEGGGQGG